MKSSAYRKHNTWETRVDIKSHFLVNFIPNARERPPSNCENTAKKCLHIYSGQMQEYIHIEIVTQTRKKQTIENLSTNMTRRKVFQAKLQLKYDFISTLSSTLTVWLKLIRSLVGSVWMLTFACRSLLPTDSSLFIHCLRNIFRVLVLLNQHI